uniref:Uncharacterized protein n=1 Tax=Molossus molossus TaxID=27622 RepID=A0A7J8HCB9_MOLMO|nr:hypothetical protein HJG59_011139 [Molossus molossus]
MVCFLASPPLLLIPHKLFFISVSASFISDWSFFMLLRSLLSSFSILITSTLNSASVRFLIFVLFSSFPRVLIFHLVHVSFVSSFWLPPCVCFYVLSRVIMSPWFPTMSYCSRYPVGSRGTTFLITPVVPLRCALMWTIHSSVVTES